MDLNKIRLKIIESKKNSQARSERVKEKDTRRQTLRNLGISGPLGSSQSYQQQSTDTVVSSSTPDYSFPHRPQCKFHPPQTVSTKHLRRHFSHSDSDNHSQTPSIPPRPLISALAEAQAACQRKTRTHNSLTLPQKVEKVIVRRAVEAELDEIVHYEMPNMYPQSSSDTISNVPLDCNIRQNCESEDDFNSELQSDCSGEEIESPLSPDNPPRIFEGDSKVYRVLISWWGQNNKPLSSEAYVSKNTADLLNLAPKEQGCTIVSIATENLPTVSDCPIGI